MLNPGMQQWRQPFLGILFCLGLSGTAQADMTSHLNIKADCGGCQSFEQFPEAIQAFGEAFLAKTKRLDLPALAPEIIIKSFKPRSLTGRLGWGVVGGRDEMSAEMRIDGMVITAQDTARSSFTGYVGVAQNVAEELAHVWSSRLGATRSVSFSEAQKPGPPVTVQPVTTSGGVRAVTPEQAAMARALGIKLD